MLHNADALAEEVSIAILFRRCAQNSIARSHSDEQVIYYPLKLYQKRKIGTKPGGKVPTT